MLGPTDMQRLATMIDPEREGVEIGPIEEVDITHLDFNYVKTCENLKELVELLAFLKSGKDGYYPALEEKIQERLAELDPVGHPLPLTKREQYDVKQAVSAELADWAASFSNQSKVEELKAKFIEPPNPIKTDSPIPINVSINSTNQKHRIKASDYQSWDKFNIDKELEKIDLNTTVPKPSPVINREKSIQIPDNLSPLQRQKFAENEKNKGNDCMRSHEYAQALSHYTTSLNLLSTVAVLNNRALCNLKLKHYDSAIKDCTTSLAMEITFKALIRRASGYFSIGKYQDGVVDVDAALELEPESKEAEMLRKQIVEKWSSCDGTIRVNSASSGKKKICIQEDDEIVTIENVKGPKIQEIFEDEGEADVQKKTKLKIIEVDEDDSDDDF